MRVGCDEFEHQRMHKLINRRNLQPPPDNVIAEVPGRVGNVTAVSYTHLDVYKRQEVEGCCSSISTAEIVMAALDVPTDVAEFLRLGWSWGLGRSLRCDWL